MKAPGSIRTSFAALALVWATAGCNCAGAPTTASPDERLGIPVMVLEGRNLSQDGTAGPLRITLRLLRTDSKGNSHVLVAYRPWRDFGTTNVHFGEGEYRYVTAAGNVEERTAPDIGAQQLGIAHLALSAEGEQPVLYFTDQLPTGQLVVWYAFDGKSWKRHEYLRSQRPDGASAPLFRSGIDQLRAFTPTELVLQHDDRLLSVKDGVATAVARPADATALRVGAIDATGVRLFWLTAAGNLVTDVLDRSSLSLRGEARRIPVSDVEFGARWNQSGTLERGVLELDSGPDTMARLRYGPQGIELFGNRPKADGTLVTVAHPDRGLVSNGIGAGNGETARTFKPLFRGTESGDFGTLAIQPSTTCPGDNEKLCQPTAEAPVAKDPACRVCTPRPLLVGSWSVLPEVTGLSALLFDTRMDNATRIYLQKLAFPLDGAVDLAFTAPTTFPGDDGTELPPVVVPSGKVLYVGRDTHEGISVSIHAPGSSVALQTVTSAADGSFAFSTLSPGDYVITASAASMRSVDIAVPASALNAYDVGAHVLPSAVPDAGHFEPDWPVTAYAGPNGDLGATELVQWDGGAIATVREGAAPQFRIRSLLGSGERPRVDNAGLVFRGGNTCASNPSTCGYVIVVANGSSYIHDNTAIVPADLRARSGVWLRAFSALDFTTAHQWDRQVNGGSFTPFLSFNAIDLRVAEQSATCGMWVWRAGADGGVGPEYGSGCNSVLAPSTFNPPPDRTPPLRQARTFGLTNGGSVLTGFEQSNCGEAAGYLQGCDAYYVHDALSAGSVGSNVVQADTLGGQTELVYLERTGTTGTLYRAPLQQPWVPTALASGLSLPASYLPGERAFYVNESGTHVFLRDAQGLKAFPAAGGAPTNLLPGAVIARQLIARDAQSLPKRHLLVHTYAGTGAPCSSALCGVSRVLLETRAVVDLGSGNGNESTSYSAASVVSDAKVWNGCPGGPCRIITWKASPTAAEVPLAIGRLWPDLSTQYVLFTGPRPMVDTTVAGAVTRSLTP